MGLFSSFFKTETPLGVQPHPDWPWVLSVGGIPSSNVAWEDVAKALDKLGPHDDSFVILEQKKDKDYWFIQSAIALAGPHTGEYVVGVGWRDAKGKHYIERCGGAGRAVDMFRAAWQGKPLDFTGFEDQSDMLSGDV
ncbi:hypothetical protein AALC17_10630 [Oscillospiraceae bacterium 38-13]